MKQVLILLVIIIIIAIFYNNKKKKYRVEYFSLFPTKGLHKECKAEGYEPAFMPSSCVKKNGYFNNHRNCKCRDKEGYCAICYPKINHTGLSISGYMSGEEFGGVVQENT